MRIVSVWIVLLLAGVSLIGCASGEREADLDANAQQLNLPPFPLDRVSNGVLETTRLGVEAFESLGGSINGDALEFAPAAGELAWGIWDFVLGGFEPQSIDLQLDVAPGDELYVALADYSLGSWDTLAPLSVGQVISLDPAKHISGAGNLFVAIMVFEGNAAAVNQLTLSSEGNLPPIADLVAVVFSGNPPLTVNFDAGNSDDPDGFIADIEWDYDGDGLFGEAENGEDLAAGSALAQYTYTELGQYDATVRVTDSGGAQDSASLQVDVVPPNVPPVADLQSNKTAVNPLESVIFDAGLSSDSDGTIADFEWDVDGDGLFNEPGAEEFRHGEPTLIASYEFPGMFHAAVRVTDDVGAQDTASVSITVYGWAFVPVDMPGNVGKYASLALIDGNPAISYRDTTNTSLKFARALNGVGANPADWGIITVDNTGNTGGHTSLAMVSGNPAISYVDNTNNALRFTRASTAAGTNPLDWASVEVDAADGAGWYGSLAVIEGNPAISYYNGNSGGLHYARASTIDGADPSDWDLLALAAGGIGPYSNLLVVASNPAICYQDSGAGELLYSRATTVTGGAAIDWSTVTVDSTDDTGQYCSLAVVDNNPAIAYRSTTGDLVYARSVTAEGDVGIDWASFTVDSVEATFCSLTVANGVPVILYRNGAGGDLCLAESSTATGDAPGDWTLSTLDQNFQPEYCSALEINGQLAVAYHEVLTGDLLYAIRLTP